MPGDGDQKTIEEAKKRLKDIEGLLARIKDGSPNKKKVAAEVKKAKDKIAKLESEADKKKLAAEIERIKKETCEECKAFEGSWADWCDSGQRAINAALGYARSKQEPSGLDAGAIVALVGVLYPPAKYASVGYAEIGVKVLDFAKKSANNLKGQSGTPKLNILHAELFESLDDVKKEKTKLYHEFRKGFEKKGFKTLADIERFHLACKKVGDKLPTQSEMQKGLLKTVLDATEDTMDWDRDADKTGKAGFADLVIQIENDGKGNLSIGKCEGQLDDVDGDVVNSIKTVWRNKAVIDLPVRIKADFHVTDNARQSYTHNYFYRTNDTAGNTSFKIEVSYHVKKAGHEAQFRKLGLKALKTMKVGLLTVDT